MVSELKWLVDWDLFSEKQNLASPSELSVNKCWIILSAYLLQFKIICMSRWWVTKIQNKSCFSVTCNWISQKLNFSTACWQKLTSTSSLSCSRSRSSQQIICLLLILSQHPPPSIHEPPLWSISPPWQLQIQYPLFRTSHFIYKTLETATRTNKQRTHVQYTDPQRWRWELND